jgi:hypothetical protein
MPRWTLTYPITANELCEGLFFGRETVVVGKILHAARKVDSLIAGGAHISLECLAVPTVIEDNGKGDATSGERHVVLGGGDTALRVHKGRQELSLTNGG